MTIKTVPLISVERETEKAILQLSEGKEKAMDAFDPPKSEKESSYEAAAGMMALARVALVAAGFKIDGVSSLGDAFYYCRPGAAARIRLATYAHGHNDTVDIAFDRRKCLDGAYLTPEEIAEVVAEAIAECDALSTKLAADER